MGDRARCFMCIASREDREILVGKTNSDDKMEEEEELNDYFGGTCRVRDFPSNTRLIGRCITRLGYVIGPNDVY